ATGSDQAVGYGIVLFAGAVFIYYSLWVIILPFVEPGQFLHQLFLPRAYAVILPLVAGVVLLTFI
ncbi:putative dolichol phosphate-mannose biosynthesis regulatory protein, partial [Apostichopus japonicus]